MNTITRMPENISGAAWVSTPDLVAVLTGNSDALELDDAIAIGNERIAHVPMKQKPAASLRAALKVAGVARVTPNAQNRAWRDSAGGKRIQARVFAQAGA